MPIIPFENFNDGNIDKYVFELLSRNSQMHGEKFELKTLQIVESDL